MEYILIKKSNLNEFKKEIKAKLDEGWVLHGDEFSFKVLDKVIYTQAVIKKNEEDVDNDEIDSIQQITASWNI